MKIKSPALVCAFLALSASTGLQAQAQADPLIDPYRDAATRIIAAATADSFAWQRLARLTDTFGHRLSGSQSLEQAIDWVLAEMRRDGLDNPRTQPVMVPHWVRGEESAELVSPGATPLPMLGLGGSIGTPKKGITAEVLVVASFDELTSAGQRRREGKIVLFDPEWKNYGETGRYRRAGAVAAAKAGAVALLIRSVGSLRHPHPAYREHGI